MATLDYPAIITRFDQILGRGLSRGLGKAGAQVCIEAAICEALGEPHGDKPSCVEEAVQAFKVRLNDSAHWRSPQSRARGLRRLGIAQLGSAGVVDGQEFSRRLATSIIRRILPMLFREVFPDHDGCLHAAMRCEDTSIPVADAAQEADSVAFAAAKAPHNMAGAAAYYVADATHYAAYATRVMSTATQVANATLVEVVDAATYAAKAMANTAYVASAAVEREQNPEKYLLLSTALAETVLRELHSPGCAYL